jgi:hypothetical protein
MVVWIVEDEAPDRRRAKQAVIAACEAEREPMPIIVETEQFIYPLVPLESNYQPNSVPNPDFVILDLFNSDERLEGDRFYKALRSDEDRSIRSFVILWSSKQWDPATEEFVQSVDKSDRRLIPLETKDAYSLECAVRQCIRKLLSRPLDVEPL